MWQVLKAVTILFIIYIVQAYNKKQVFSSFLRKKKFKQIVFFLSCSQQEKNIQFFSFPLGFLQGDKYIF